MKEQRPDPEKLLQQIQKEERQEQQGKLKIYLGAAPGVGKTYTMLQDALVKHSHGLDVVIGIIESHGRQEINSLLINLESLPRQPIEYHGKQLFEFDLDATLNRKPQLVLIDEMAHTNAPGLRHSKRWQDIKELLDRGINVHTTLNVQHIESLSDDASQIIHAPIKETVPDSMLAIADTIELIDLPPQDLLKRLQEGKVYYPKQAELAQKYFFRKGNLIALRELALRFTAERVGAEVISYRQGQGIHHIWPSKEKILVCVGPGKESLKLIHATCRMAASSHTDWIAVYVDLIQLKSSASKRNHAIQHLRSAERLGAETRVLTGFDFVREIMSFAREQNITLIMLWKHIRPRWKNLFHRNLADEIVRNSGEIDVYIMTGTVDGNEPQQPIGLKYKIPYRAYVAATFLIALATIINCLLYPFLQASSLIMVYLLSVTIVALFGQIGPSVLASILSVLAYDFFFTPPFYGFIAGDIEYFFTLIVMLLVTQVISHLTVLTQRQTAIARRTEQQTSALYKLSRQLAGTRGIDKLLEIGVQYIANVFDCEVFALLPQNGRLEIRSPHKTQEILNTKEQSIAQWVYELGQVAGFGTDTLTDSLALYVPLLASRSTIGVLRLCPSNQSKRFFTPEQMHLLETCANQIALALEVDLESIEKLHLK